MRGGAGFWVVVAALAVLHFLLHLGIGLEAEAPDLLTLAVLFAARAGGAGIGAGLGFFLGLLEDALSILAFGANTVAMTAIGTLGAGTRDLFLGDSILFVPGYVMLGKWLRDLLFWIVAGETVREPFVQAILVDGVVAAVYLGLVGTALALLTGRAREMPR